MRAKNLMTSKVFTVKQSVMIDRIIFLIHYEKKCVTHLSLKIQKDRLPPTEDFSRRCDRKAILMILKQLEVKVTLHCMSIPKSAKNMRLSVLPPGSLCLGCVGHPIR